MPKFEISEYQLNTGVAALGVELPIAPYGDVLMHGDDTSENCRALLVEIIGTWERLWPTMRKRLQECNENLATPVIIRPGTHLACVARTQKGCFMADKSDIYLSLEFAASETVSEDADAPSQWDYFIRGSRVVHFQPVF